MIAFSTDITNIGHRCKRAVARMLLYVTRRETENCWSGIACADCSMIKTTLNCQRLQDWAYLMVTSHQQAVLLVGKST